MTEVCVSAPCTATRLSVAVENKSLVDLCSQRYPSTGTMFLVTVSRQGVVLQHGVGRRLTTPHRNS